MRKQTLINKLLRKKDKSYLNNKLCSSDREIKWFLCSFLGLHGPFNIEGRQEFNITYSTGNNYECSRIKAINLQFSIKLSKICFRYTQFPSICRRQKMSNCKETFVYLDLGYHLESPPLPMGYWTQQGSRIK